MTLVHHATRDTHAVLCDVIARLGADAKKAHTKLRWIFGKKTACWLRFAIVPEGIALPEQLGNPDRPYQSALVLDRDGTITQELIQEGLNALSVDGVYAGKLERFEQNPFLGIFQPYYEFTLEVRRY